MCRPWYWYTIVFEKHTSQPMLEKCRTLGASKPIPAFVLVNIVNCESEFLDMVESHQECNLQLCTYVRISLK